MCYHVKNIRAGSRHENNITTTPQYNTPPPPQNKHFLGELVWGCLPAKMTTTPLCLPRDEASECMIIEGNEGTGPRIIDERKMDYRHVQKLP
jgi:hypothetical protein